MCMGCVVHHIQDTKGDWDGGTNHGVFKDQSNLRGSTH